VRKEKTRAGANKKLRARAFGKLRAKAEAKLKKKITVLQKQSDGDINKVLHELSVHQIELEMQNEELLRAQKELEDSRSKYADLYDFAPVGYFAFDKNAHVIEANLTGCTMLGINRADLIKSAFHTFVDKDSQDQFYLHRQHVLKTTVRQTCEIFLTRKDGTKIEVQLESIPAKDNKGKFTLCRTAITDITERKQSEEASRQSDAIKKLNEELNRSNRDLEQYAYVASHDLREPLRGIKGFMELLYKAYKDKLDEKAIEYIKYATDSTKRMEDLLTCLLQYSHIQTKGKAFSPIDTKKALWAALANLQKNVEETGAYITSDELPMVKADGIQITQLLQNLIANAIKFRGEQKPEIHVGCQKYRDNRDWQFSVRDNGIGIDPQFNDRIFVIFQRLHARDKYQGYGIGLSICKRIVERHGGRIWVESEAGKGATFYFTIPDNG